MAYLFVPIAGQFAGGEESPLGEPLGWAGWSGLEFTRLASPPDLWAAVSEAEMRDWVIGARFPLWSTGPDAVQVFAADPAARAASLQAAQIALDDAHGAGARYLVLPVAWPAPGIAGPDGAAVAAAIAELADLAGAAGLQVRLALRPEATSCTGRPEAQAARTDLTARTALAEACLRHEQVRLALDPMAGAALAGRLGQTQVDYWQVLLPVTHHLYVHQAIDAGQLAADLAGRHRQLRVVVAAAPETDALARAALRSRAASLMPPER